MGSFDSLRHRNYRLLWIGAVLSNVGTWMQNIALAWFVFRLTGSAFWVSFITFAGMAPMILSPVGGVYTDRLDRRKILLVSQTVMLLDAAVLAALAWTGHATLLAVMLLTFATGVMFAFNGPTWQAFITSLVPSEDIVNAIALNSAQFNLARVIGPAVAGILVGTLSRGAAIVFTFNAASFVAVLVSLVLIRGERKLVPQRRSVWELLRTGVRATWTDRRIRSMIVAIGVMSMFAAPVSALLPIFAADVYGRGSGAYGTLAAAFGLGSVAGALILGRVGNRLSAVHVATALVALGLLLVLFSAISVFALGVGLLFVFGAAYLLFTSGTNSQIQTIVSESLRGRVMSIWFLAFGLMYPIGSLIAGAVVARIGAPVTFVVGGAVSAAWGVGMLVRLLGPARQARPLLEPGV